MLNSQKIRTNHTGVDGGMLSASRSPRQRTNQEEIERQLSESHSLPNSSAIPELVARVVGGPTLKGILKKAKACGYTWRKAFGDIVDGGITIEGTTKVYINFIQSQHDNKILEFTVSDDNTEGMFKLQYDGTRHPLCWTHETDDHEDDGAISEYGSGLKAAACNVAAEMSIISSYIGPTEDRHYKYLLCNWKEMADKYTFDPAEESINEQIYNKKHPFETGTTFIFKDIDHSCVPIDGVSIIEDYLRTTYYNKMLDGLEVRVNNVVLKPYVPPTESETPYEIYKYSIKCCSNSKNEEIYLFKQQAAQTRWHQCEYNGCDVSASAIDKQKYDVLISEFSKEKYKLEFKACKCQGTPNDPQKATIGGQQGSIVIARQGRVLTDGEQIVCFGKPSHEHNHNYFKLDYVSKKINKILKISYSKSISTPFPNNFLTKVLEKIYKLLKIKCGSNTQHNNMWHNEWGIAWNSKLSHGENLSIGIGLKEMTKRIQTLWREKMRRKETTTTTVQSRSASSGGASSNSGQERSKSGGSSSIEGRSVQSMMTTQHSSSSSARRSPKSSQQSSKSGGSSSDISSGTTQSIAIKEESKKTHIHRRRVYLVLEGDKNNGPEIFTDDAGNKYVKPIIGITQQDVIKRMGGGNYYNRTARHWQCIPINKLAYEKGASGHMVIEDILLIELRKVPGVEVITNEEFKVPVGSMLEFSKIFNQVCLQFFDI